MKLLIKGLFAIALCCIAMCLNFCGTPKKRTVSPGFVTIEDKTFKLDGKDFYPMVLNYGVDLAYTNNVFWTCPSNTGFGNQTIKHNKESAKQKLKADMQMIKDLGFNAVRLVGVVEYELKDGAIKKHADADKDTVVILDGETMEKYLNGLDEMFKVLDEIGIKAIVLTKKMPDENAVVDKHL